MPTQYIVRCIDITKITVASEITQIGVSEFYIVITDDYDTLLTQVESIEDADINVKFQGVINTLDILQTDAIDNWGRKRMAARTFQSNLVFDRSNVTYIRQPEVFVVDSGINFLNPEFNAVEIVNFYKVGGIAEWGDVSGHGTAVASVICGQSVGIHNHLKLMNVQITTDIYKPTLLELGDALNAILDHHIATPNVPKVVNCSWTINKSAYLDAIVSSLIASGIAVVAAAGNTGINSDTLSPAGVADVITVAASDIEDFSAGFNNFSTADLAINTNNGLLIDIFAPGVDVAVATDGTTGFGIASGTSLSAGYVTGSVASIMAMLPDIFGIAAKTILNDIATRSMLLLDYTKFTEDQNNLAFLLSASNASQFEKYNMFLYAFGQDGVLELQVKLADIISTDPLSIISNKTDRILTLEYPDISNESDLAPYITIDNLTDAIVINAPSLTFAPGEDMRLLSFKVVATYPSVTYKSANLLIYVIDPDTTDDLVAAMDTTLSELNAIRLYNNFMVSGAKEGT